MSEDLQPIPDPRDDVYIDGEDNAMVDPIVVLSAVEVNEDQRESTEESNNKTLKSRPKKSRKNSNEFVCNECQPKRYFQKKSVLDEHKDVLHSDVITRVVCLWCAKGFCTENQLKVHQILYFHDKPIL